MNKFVNVTLLFLINTIVSAQGVKEELLKVVASDGDDKNRFGTSVSIYGDYAIVGAAFDDNTFSAAYIYHFDGTIWKEQAKLSSGIPGNLDQFGYAVSIYGDYAVVGAYLDYEHSLDGGAVYVFVRQGTKWVKQAKLTPSDANVIRNNNFGISVNVRDDYIIVGAFADDEKDRSAGAAYIFTRQGANWVEKTKLMASDGTMGDLFGYSVSINDSYAIVGAYFDHEPGSGTHNHTGSAYIFSSAGDNWIEEAKLIASDAAFQGQFGISVDIDKAYAIVGTTSGSAYVFAKDSEGWLEQTKLTLPNATGFGISVDIEGSYALIGATGDSGKEPGTGSGYLFYYNEQRWIEQAKLIASDGNEYDFFGSTVSLSGNRMIIGSPTHDEKGVNDGAAYLFNLDSLIGTDYCSLLSERVSLKPDIVVCDKDSVVLNSMVSNADYLWSTGQTIPSITVTTSNTYWVQIKQNGCIVTDTITVDFLKFDLGKDTVFCETINHTLKVDNPQAQLLWSTGETSPSIRVTESGVYWVKARQGGCTAIDSIHVDVLEEPDLGADTLFCETINHTLGVNDSAASILWSTGESGKQITVTQAGIYWVAVNKGTCSAVDSIYIDVLQKPKAEVIDTIICQDETVSWSIDTPRSTYYWDDGSTSPNKLFRRAGEYNVFIANECFTFQQTIVISTEDCNCDVFVPNIFTPNNDSSNDNFQPQLHHKVTVISLRIYNRWGSLLYSSEGFATWNGTLQNRDAAEGNYYWVLDYHCLQNDEIIQHQKKGWLTLKRK